MTWQAPAVTDAGGHAATGYKSYRSKHGKAVTGGVEINANTYTFSNLKAGQTYYFKITALGNILFLL